MEKNNSRVWRIAVFAFVCILVWHITAGIMPALANGVKALTPFLLAFVTAYLLRYPVELLEKLFCRMQKNKKHKWQHTLAVFIPLVCFFGLVVVGLIVLVPNIIANVTDIVVALPEFIVDVQEFANEQVENISRWLEIDINGYATDYINGVAQKALDLAKNIEPQSIFFAASNFLTGTASVLMDTVLYAASSFFLLYDFNRMKGWIHQVLHLVTSSEKTYNTVCGVLHTADVTMEKYIVVQLCTSLGMGIVCYIGFLIFGLPYAILLATVAALTNLIPYIGPVIGMVAPIVVALTAGDLKTAIGVAVFMLVCQQLEGNVITPLLTGDALNINPLLVLLGVAVFGAMFGIPGMLIGAPAVAVIANMIRNATADKNANKDSGLNVPDTAQKEN